MQERVVDPEKFVEGVEETVVIHADQVPCWLSTGTLRQLYGEAEVRGAEEEARGGGAALERARSAGAGR